ncbi:unnamed protein product [Linum trigynum]
MECRFDRLEELLDQTLLRLPETGRTGCATVVTVAEEQLPYQNFAQVKRPPPARRIAQLEPSSSPQYQLSSTKVACEENHSVSSPPHKQPRTDTLGDYILFSTPSSPSTVESGGLPTPIS